MLRKCFPGVVLIRLFFARALMPMQFSKRSRSRPEFVTSLVQVKCQNTSREKLIVQALFPRT